MAEETDKIPPSYDDVNLDGLLDEAHQNIDGGKLQPKPPYPLAMQDEDDGGPAIPESVNTVYTKYRTEAEVPKSQRKDFDQYRGAYGRHVALGNTKRMDNLRHLNALDLQYIYDGIPTMRHRATLVRIRETSEVQMCRSNPEIGGFEAKIPVTSIRREDVDVRQAQSLVHEMKQKKKGGMLKFLRR